MKLTESDAKVLGGVIRKHREDVGMSRSKLCQKIGKDPSSLQAYEQGGKKVYNTWIVANPKEETLELIAGALGTTAQALLMEAGLSEASEVAGAAAMADAANGVRAVNISGAAEDVAALLGLALERGLLGKLKFTPVSKGV